MDGRGWRGHHEDTKSLKVEFDNLSNRVIGCAIESHRHWDRGRVRRRPANYCVADELSRNKIAFQLPT